MDRILHSTVGPNLTKMKNFWRNHARNVSSAVIEIYLDGCTGRYTFVLVCFEGYCWLRWIKLNLEDNFFYSDAKFRETARTRKKLVSNTSERKKSLNGGEFFSLQFWQRLRTHPFFLRTFGKKCEAFKGIENRHKFFLVLKRFYQRFYLLSQCDFYNFQWKSKKSKLVCRNLKLETFQTWTCLLSLL